MVIAGWATSITISGLVSAKLLMSSKINLLSRSILELVLFHIKANSYLGLFKMNEARYFPTRIKCTLIQSSKKRSNQETKYE